MSICWCCGQAGVQFGFTAMSLWQCLDCQVRWLDNGYWAASKAFKSYGDYVAIKRNIDASTERLYEITMIDFGEPGALSSPA